MGRVPLLTLAAGLVAALGGCTQVSAPPATPARTEPLVAIGHEPGWRLDIDAGRLTLLADYGETRLSMPAPSPDDTSDGLRYTGQADGHNLAVTVLDEVCEDGATGMPRPFTVTVVLDGRVMTGCGGETAAILEGPWIVTAIDGRPPAGGTSPSIAFTSGRVSGQAPCNAFTGAYTLGAERLEIGELAVTRRACAEDVMAQERTMLAVLREVDQFGLAADGTMRLRTADGRGLVARRE